jgi:hypothetical protein
MQNLGYTQRDTLTETYFLGAKFKLCLKKDTLPGPGTAFFLCKTEVIPKRTANRDSFSWCKTKVHLKGQSDGKVFTIKIRAHLYRNMQKKKVFHIIKLKIKFFLRTWSRRGHCIKQNKSNT